MNKLIGWGIAAVGGYYLLQYFGYLNPVVSDGTTDTPQASGSTTVDANRVTTTMQLMRDYIVAQGGKSEDRLNLDELGWIYQHVSGTVAPSPESIGYDGSKRTGLYTVGEYMTIMSSKGFSGLGNIAHRINPYWNSQGTPYGSNLLPVGFEKYIVHKGL